MPIAPHLGPDEALSPFDWRAKRDYDKWSDRFTPDDGIAIHHGGGGNYPAHNAPFTKTKEIAQILNWERYHLGKGWRGLAYGWAIGMTGTIYRIRGWNRYGAHLGDVDGDGVANNDEVIPVLFIMSSDRTKPTPEALAAFERLRAYLEAESGRALWLYGHQEVQTQRTGCPGKHLMKYVKANRVSGNETVPPMTGQHWPTLLAWGDRDKSVRTLRGLLYSLGYLDSAYGGVLASKFTKSVDKAVRAFQDDWSLDIDGIVGPKTRAALVEAMGEVLRVAA